MHNKLFVIAVALLLAATTQIAVAQNGNGLGVGVRAGINIADYTSSTGQPRIGFTGGVFGDYTISRFGFEAGVYYSEQGSLNVVEQSLPGNRANYSLDYIVTQLLVKYQLFNGFRVFAGPNAASLINSRREYYQLDGTKANKEISTIRGFDMGIHAGVGYTFKFGLDVSASYTHGFFDVFINDEREAYTSVFKVTVGWNFLRKKQ